MIIQTFSQLNLLLRRMISSPANLVTWHSMCLACSQKTIETDFLTIIYCKYVVHHISATSSNIFEGIRCHNSARFTKLAERLVFFLKKTNLIQNWIGPRCNSNCTIESAVSKESPKDYSDSSKETPKESTKIIKQKINLNLGVLLRISSRFLIVHKR